MRTIDRVQVCAPLTRVFELARDVERWPMILAHYRWVRVLERGAEHAVVEMAAWRPFGPIRYPAWWVSEMRVNDADRRIRYRHVRGITAGMDVAWTVSGVDGAAEVSIVHAWDGPGWPLIGSLAAHGVIGPVFVHGIATRTLAGIRRAAEAA
jgi:coenzyme Q-binding protein COQ10